MRCWGRRCFFSTLNRKHQYQHHHHCHTATIFHECWYELSEFNRVRLFNEKSTNRYKELKIINSLSANDHRETIYENGKNEQVQEKNVASTTKTLVILLWIIKNGLVCAEPENDIWINGIVNDLPRFHRYTKQCEIWTVKPVQSNNNKKFKTKYSEERNKQSLENIARNCSFFVLISVSNETVQSFSRIVLLIFKKSEKKIVKLKKEVNTHKHTTCNQNLD